MDRPHVTLKLATSLDGRIATASGQSKWITGEAARAEVHKMRAAAAAIMIGAGTARADDPSLLPLTEPPATTPPARVVITNAFDIPFEGKLFAHLDRSPLIVFGRQWRGTARQAILEGAGARVETAPALDQGLDMAAVLARLREIAPGPVLAEGGGGLAATLVTQGLVDRLEWFRAPILLGAEGRPAVAALALAQLAEAPKWRRVAVRELGPDLWESYERV
jgi:diaminohydroxyphosphoribosylaminopyrimidine deaminase/5-amino-6-(5-phosphoribosylamino)uracil reductase